MQANQLMETKRRMVSLIEEHGALALSRQHPTAHFTASAIVCTPDHQVLALHHRKLQRWLQPGGHIEANDSSPLIASVREAQEESGLTDLIPLAPYPIDLDIHTIPARADEAEHEHFDIRYALLTQSPHLIEKSDESTALKWLAGQELTTWMETSTSILRPISVALQLLSDR